MCGICGIVSTDTRVVSSDRLERMSAVLRHRGPDDSGLWISSAGAEKAGFGHQRLSIVDLSTAGHQPMTNEDGSVWVTYNGEIYNHSALRSQLEAAGHVYHSRTDTETILHGYEEWGDRCVERFRGMFAFALWDDKRRRLLLGRDRVGIKPLYFAEIDGGLIFASEIKSILESGLIRPELAPRALPEYLTFGYLAGPGTMFKGIEKLQPGELLEWRAGKITRSRYWDLQFNVDLETSEEEFERRFNSLFEESIELRLMSDVPLGVFLSGGLDSSAIAAVMQRLVKKPIQTFSVGYESGYYSELGYAKEVAKLVGSDHHEIILTPDMFVESLPALTWHEDEPMWGTASVALYFVSQLASQHVTVVLSGEGSDELFAGYDRYWLTQLNASTLPVYELLPTGTRNAIRSLLLNGPLPERLRRALGHTIVNHHNLPDRLFLENWFGVFSPAAQRRIAGPALLSELESVDVYASHRELFDTPTGDLLQRMLYTDIRGNLVELLMKQDQMSMATSIESRVPFLDHKLVEFAGTVPSHCKVRRFSGKHLLKRALATQLPQSIRYRRKMGFPVPFEAWLNEHYLPQVRQLLLSDRFLQRGWLQPAAVKSLFDQHASGRMNHTRQIWTLWGLELWAQIFLDREMPASLHDRVSPPTERAHPGAPRRVAMERQASAATAR